MASNGYSLKLFTLAGASLGEVGRYAGLEYAFGETLPGVCYVVLADPHGRAQDYAPLTVMEIWRETEGRWTLEGDRLWYLMDTIDAIDAQGIITQTLVFYDANAMLQGRWVLYPAGNANADMTDNADDMLKSIVDTNCTTNATDTDRAWTGLTIAADLAACTSISKAFAWRPVLTVMQEIAAQARENCEYLTWDFVRTGICTHEFRTYTGQRGVNRGASSGQMLRLTAENGGLKNPILTFARAGYPNHITAAGTGEEAARSTMTATDTVAPLGMLRYERIIDRSNVDNDTDLQSEADAEYQAVRPRFVFTGKLGETKSIRYGFDVYYGDIVSVNFAGYEFDAHITAVHVALDGQGNETLDIGLKNYV